jgi:hypothetical protein
MAFLMPNSGYKFAQKLQDTKKVPSTSKIYPVLERLVKTGYLTYDKNKYHHNPVKITEDLIDYLEYYDVTIEENERKILQNMLTSGYFFNILSADVYDELTTRQSGSHDIDALEFFRNKIGLLSTIFSHLKKLNPQHDNLTRESFEKVNEDLTGMVEHVNKTMPAKLKGSTSFKKKKLDSYDLLVNTMKSGILLIVLFQKIPDETLEKFAKLWDQHQGFVLGSKLGQFDSMESLQKFCNEQMKTFENHNKT